MQGNATFTCCWILATCSYSSTKNEVIAEVQVCLPSDRTPSLGHGLHRESLQEYEARRSNHCECFNQNRTDIDREFEFEVISMSASHIMANPCGNTWCKSPCHKETAGQVSVSKTVASRSPHGTMSQPMSVRCLQFCRTYGGCSLGAKPEPAMQWRGTSHPSISYSCAK